MVAGIFHVPSAINNPKRERGITADPSLTLRVVMLLPIRARVMSVDLKSNILDISHALRSSGRATLEQQTPKNSPNHLLKKSSYVNSR